MLEKRYRFTCASGPDSDSMFPNGSYTYRATTACFSLIRHVQFPLPSAWD